MENEAELFYRQLPKVELHAHLNGSVSVATTKRLIARKPHLNIDHSMTAILKGQRRTLDECFQVFKVIHQLIDTEEDLLMVTKSVIREFAEDGVRYLELRSTPRADAKTGMPPYKQITMGYNTMSGGNIVQSLTKRRYVESIIEAIRQCKEEDIDTEVRFLVAVDRRNGAEVAMETVKLAEDYMLASDGLVVGMDLSGDPNVGHGKDFLPALQKARNCGLKLTLHMSEVPSQKEESELLLTLPPDRIGHGTFLHPEMGGSQSLMDRVQEKNIPLELCLTSNVKVQTVGSYQEHHFPHWYQLGHPCVICTDDKGVFSTSLSMEYQLAAATFGLSREAVWTLSQQAIGCSFGTDAVKQELQRRWALLLPEVFPTSSCLHREPTALQTC